jgi:hypothetical protein
MNGNIKNGVKDMSQTESSDLPTQKPTILVNVPQLILILELKVLWI